ncbi:hypothetical protein [Erythrobacter sp.]|jgi:hypothetical protein|uniref:hypothetical protein n=1 Tax=Erythrobacter sp. TaxID=1042 RepID=UPI002EA75E69|nr:hypothetical protein [Erythrobacter sp.]
MWDWAYLIPLAPFLMVVLIVWMQQRNKMEEKRLEATASQSAEKAAQYSSQIAQLESRVQVLERIVTDGGYDVATQIEALRDVKDVQERRVAEEDGSGVPLNIAKKEDVG